MNLEVTKASYKSHVYNEDRILINKNLFIVMDGASSLTETDKLPTSASWLVNRLKYELGKKVDNVIDRLYSLSKKLYLEYGSIDNLVYLPSCGMAICEISSDKAIFYTIGDCEITYLTKDGILHLVKYDELNNLDNKAIKTMEDVAKENNIPMLEARKRINDLLIENRKLMNKENGYQVYTINDNPNFVFKKCEVKTNDISCIYVYSDGFAQAYTTLKLYDYQDLFKNNLDVENVKNEIVRLWKKDSKCEKFPRFKKADDISVIKIKLD